ncbi:MAG: hypothetical protein KBA81_06890 [Rhabdochlamydiaceae bacterium]|nr:hypothetical protein [Rhabdochlamydiaceae bacterium]
MTTQKTPENAPLTCADIDKRWEAYWESTDGKEALKPFEELNASLLKPIIDRVLEIMKSSNKGGV